MRLRAVLSGEKEKLGLEGKPSPSERGLGHGTLLPSTGHIPTRAAACAPCELVQCQMPSEPPSPTPETLESQALTKHTHATH